MGWLIALAIVLGLAILPLGVYARYDTDGFTAKLRIGPIRIPLYPRPQKDKKEEKPKEKSSKSNKNAQNTKAEKRGGNFADFLPLIEDAVKFLDHFRRKLLVKRLELKLTLAGDDPCDLAVNYGRAWALVSNLVPQLERFLKIKKRDIGVACDFTAENTVIYCLADIRLSVGAFLYLLARRGGGIAKKIYKLIKGGAEK